MGRTKRWSSVATIGALAAIASPVVADVQVLDRAALEIQLAGGVFCCVIDVRGDAERRRDPLDGARPWPDRTPIDAGAVVVVIGSRPAAAKRYAVDIAARQPEARILIPAQGIIDWRFVADGRAALPPPGMRFIIPRNTCDPATVIMEMRGDDPRNPR